MNLTATINSLIETLDWDKTDGLIPCIVQDASTAAVLMMAYVSRDSLLATAKSKKMVFYSRSREKLWLKGEESGNFLELISIKSDCDNDTLLAQVNPVGPVCHTGTDTCWDEKNAPTSVFHKLESTIQDRRDNPTDKSYTASLFAKGINKVAQKVGEEAVELVIEAKDNDKDLFLNEAADLMYHFLVLLAAKGYELREVEEVLRGRER